MNQNDAESIQRRLCRIPMYCPMVQVGSAALSEREVAGST